MDTETIEDFKWLFSGGILLLAGEILIIGGINGTFLIAGGMVVWGFVLLVGGFYGKKARQLLSRSNTE